MTHLGDADCRALLAERGNESEREEHERHLEICEPCQDLMARLIDEGDLDVEAPEPLDVASDILLRAFVSRAPRRAKLNGSNTPLIAQLAATSGGALELDLLRLLGSTGSFAQCALRLEAPKPALEAACRDLRKQLREYHGVLLKRAEQAARDVCGEETFRRFERRAGGRANEPDIDDGHEKEPGVDDGPPAESLRHAAADPRQARQYECLEDRDYSLFVEEVDDGEKRTLIRCLGPGKRRPWRYRLWFEHADEENALASHGLGAEERGALRIAHALRRDRWTELLDLLLPWRFGTGAADADPAFREVIHQGSVKGWFPGIPKGGKLWLLG